MTQILSSEAPAPGTGDADPQRPEVPPADADAAAAEWVPPTWEEVVRDHGARVYRLALRLTGNPHDAEDLTQDVFIRVFRSLHRFQPGTFEGWLHRITTNLFLDGARRRQKIRFSPLADPAGEHLPSGRRTPSEVLDDAGLDHDVAAALDALLPEFRAAVVLCDIEGLSYDEIAAVLDVKIGTVRSRIHRGRAQLREALAHRRPGEDRERYYGLDAERCDAFDSRAPAAADEPASPGQLVPATRPMSARPPASGAAPTTGPVTGSATAGRAASADRQGLAARARTLVSRRRDG